MRRLALGLALAGAAAGTPLGAQAPATAAADDASRTLSLEEALRLAEGKSEAVRVARAGLTRARGELLRARSQFLPQLYASAQYQRTLKSQFEVLQGPPDTRPECRTFAPTNGTAEERIEELEEALALATNCRSLGGIDFSRVGFGAKNEYRIGVSFSQSLFAGGRVTSQYRAARAGEAAAETEVAAQRALTILEVTQAYYDAVLAERLAAIADSSLVQTEQVLQQVRLARSVGNTSEFELLRASVTRDNQVPVAIQRRADREVALLRLKQLLELPLDADLRLTTDLGESEPAPITQFASFTPSAAPDTAADARSTVRQAAEAVRAQEALLRATRASRLPSVNLVSQYGRVAYPNAGVPEWSQFSQNWTVGVAMQMPLFTGGRLRGEELIARASVEEARARLEQARELASLDALVALSSLRQAEAAWTASTGTAGQAVKAYSIAEIRYREGISTQTELNDARLLLQQAQANRALAARDLQLARVRLALLRDLPLGAPGAASVPGGGGRQGAPAAPRSQQAPQQTPQNAADNTQSGQAGGFAP